MTTSTDRQQYRALVADVVARAKAILPQAVNGRLEGAVKLVLLDEVQPGEDGTILVGSCTDPLKTYRLVGTTCECKDFTDGKAPQGWCRHRIAAGIAKRVGELLPPPQAAPLGQPAPQATLPEAPASANCHIMIEGRQVQITLRDTDEGRLLQRLTAVLAQYPVAQPVTPGAAQGQGQGRCNLHNVKLHLNHGKDGRTWLSHRLPEGGFCKGK